jgi:DNA-binding IclR family transcriptional regulator
MNASNTPPIGRDASRGSSGDRLLAALALFTVERPEWTVEAAAETLGVSATTTYRYFKSLVKAGLISPVAGAGYMLGPAIIQMDRQIQLCDPMLIAARGAMVDLINNAAEGTTVLLCRLFHDRVMCVHQVVGRGPQTPVSYQRGRPMPLFRGATSKIILACLPTRTLKTMFAHDAAEIAGAGLGNSWDEFRASLAALRRAGVCVSRGEIDPGRIGIAAPIFDAQRAILGSLTIVLPMARGQEPLVERLARQTIAGARAIERAMNDKTSTQPSAARVKIAR